MTENTSITVALEQIHHHNRRLRTDNTTISVALEQTKPP